MSGTRGGLLAVALTCVAATTISAGGWAVVTVDDLPEYITAGEPVTLAYTVRQHGNNLLGGLHGRIEAERDGQKVAAEARPGRFDGHYVATLAIPASGDWSLTIHSGFGGQGTLALLPLRVVDRANRAAPLAAAERGRQLFVAKGCVTCHRVDGKTLPAGGQQGPVIVPQKYQPEFLVRALANPALLPPQPNHHFRMPNLGLKGAEIDALVAFINDRGTAATTASRQR
jgi:mono/diheme cytochrome c family protein